MSDRLCRSGLTPPERYLDPPLVVPMDIAVDRAHEIFDVIGGVRTFLDRPCGQPLERVRFLEHQVKGERCSI